MRKLLLISLCALIFALIWNSQVLAAPLQASGEASVQTVFIITGIVAVIIALLLFFFSRKESARDIAIKKRNNFKPSAMQKPLAALQKTMASLKEPEAVFEHLEVCYVRLFINSRRGDITPLYASCYAENGADGQRPLLMGRDAVEMKQRIRSEGLELAGPLLLGGHRRLYGHRQRACHLRRASYRPDLSGRL